MAQSIEQLSQLVEQNTQSNGWKLIRLPTSRVDLPSQPVIHLKDIIETITDTHEMTVEEYLLEQRLEKAKAKRSAALEKQITVTENDIQTLHTCTLELGRIQKDGSREYLFEYTYKKEDFSLSIFATNRKYYEDQPQENLVALWVEAKNIPMRRRPFPRLHIFFDEGVLSSFFYKNRFELSPVTRSALFNYRCRPFPKILFTQDLQIHQLNMQQTIHNLLNNINSDTPINPLQCFVFQGQN